jgi:pyruvate/2-oxoglutarate/acetoin dehydrogenase E1 component
MPKTPVITFADAINDALVLSMKKDKNMICYGLGITDPKNIFGTTKNLLKKFGEQRVFDVPCSENALTGISIGAALSGVRSVVTHQRLDFFLLAMDQLVNAAAKWYYMFGSQKSVPITIRLIIGKGWGQGPTHSQNLQAWFNHIPGLKVVMPYSPEDAKGLLIASIFDPNPVIFLEHRWLHNTKSFVKKEYYELALGKAKVLKKGKDITILSISYLNIEAIKAAKFLLSEYKIDAEVIDIRTIKPMDWVTIFKSIKKTGRLLVLDTASITGSISSDIIAKTVTEKSIVLKSPPARMAMPDIPEPTSYGLSKEFFLSDVNIINFVLKILKIKINNSLRKKILKNRNYDQPYINFNGPF